MSLIVDVSAGRGLPPSAQILRHAALPALVDDVRAHCRARLFGVDVERFHTLGRPRRELQRAIVGVLALPALRTPLDAIVADVARFRGLTGPLVVQREPYARAQLPATREGCQPFHIDAYVGHPRAQQGLWVPLADIVGPEGLWLLDDAPMAAAVERGALGDQQDALRALARPTPMRAGELLVLSSTTGHGGVPHALDRTRASFDLRVTRSAEAPSGRLGWTSRPLTPVPD